jgi:hypothetical protein
MPLLAPLCGSGSEVLGFFLYLTPTRSRRLVTPNRSHEGDQATREAFVWAGRAGPPGRADYCLCPPSLWRLRYPAEVLARRVTLGWLDTDAGNGRASSPQQAGRPRRFLTVPKFFEGQWLL